MTKDLKVHEDICTISYVSETKTRGVWNRPESGRRFVIGAEKLEGDSLGERLIGLTTFDAWMASLCDQAQKMGFRVKVKYRYTRYFDASLLYVERVPDSPEVTA